MMRGLDKWIEGTPPDMPNEPDPLPECWLCGRASDETELRRQHDGYWTESAQHVCEECFNGGDEGPCFDDLPLSAPTTRAKEE